MITTMPKHGFVVVGGKLGQRQRVIAAVALAGYAACDEHAEVDKEAYLSAFQYGDDFIAHLKATTEGSTAGYDGVCWAPWLWFDIDFAADPERALADARRLTTHLLHRYPVLDEGDVLAFFSGAKGYHVGLPTFWHPEPSVTFHKAARRFAEKIATDAGVTIDAGVYDKVRLFRAPNSKHPKTGLHKRRLSNKELMHLTPGRIAELAAAPEPFGVPVVTATCQRAADDWRDAAQAVAVVTEAKARRRVDTSGSPRLNRSTVEFIRDGAAEGDRHRLLFSAAANLAEFPDVASLAHALLTEPGLDSGLTPSDVNRQIECGLAHTGKGTAHA